MAKKKTVWVDPESLEPGPYQRTHLAPELRRRVERVFEITKSAQPNTSLEEFVDGFLRDGHPEIEIVVWEKIARAFQMANLPLDKQSLLGELVVISMAGSEAKEKSQLSPEQFDELLAVYQHVATN